MTRKMIWGVALLILLLVSAAVFVILHETADNRQLNDQLADAGKLADEINKRKISENNPLPKEPISNPLENQDDTEVPNKNSQQNGNVETVNESVEKVLADNFIEGVNRLDLDLFASITLPTNDELASYTDEDIKELYRVIHETHKKARAIDEEFRKRIEAIHETSYHHDKLDSEKSLQLSNQNAQLRRVLSDWQEQGKQWRQETERIGKYRRGF